MLHIVDMEGRLSGSEKRVGGFDLIWNDGPVASDELALHCGQPLSYSTNSFLGCYNDRYRGSVLYYVNIELQNLNV